MGQLVKIVPEEVRQVGNVLRTSMEDIRQKTQSLLASVNRMDWISTGRDQFIDDISNLVVRISQLSEEGDELSRRLNSTVEKWESAAATVTGASAAAAGAAAASGAAGGAAASGAASGESTTRPGYEWLKPGERVVGAPVELNQYNARQKGNTCAIYAQGNAMKALGLPFDVDETLKAGHEVGYYKIGPFDGSFGLGKVWDHYGVAYDSFSQKSLLIGGPVSEKSFNEAANFLIKSISENKAVIVGVEIDTLYDGIGNVKENYIGKDGHAVWVTGLLTDSSGNVTDVLMNDSVVGHSTRVPVSNFMNAWRTKSYQAIASKEAIKVN